jgi:hypothetical protein
MALLGVVDAAVVLEEVVHATTPVDAARVVEAHAVLRMGEQHRPRAKVGEIGHGEED